GAMVVGVDDVGCRSGVVGRIRWSYRSVGGDCRSRSAAGRRCWWRGVCGIAAIAVGVDGDRRVPRAAFKEGVDTFSGSGGYVNRLGGLARPRFTYTDTHDTMVPWRRTATPSPPGSASPR